VTGGLIARERVIVMRSDRRETDSLLTALRRRGADPVGAEGRGQLVVPDKRRIAGLYAMSDGELAADLARQAAAALRDGFTGIRFGGTLVGTRLSPHEPIINTVVRAHPVSTLCLYSAGAPTTVLSAADRLHDRRITDEPRPGNASQPIARPAVAAAASGLDAGARPGTPVRGTTGAAVVTNLTWRVFGDTRTGRGGSVLAWAGLLGQIAGAVPDVAAAHHISRSALLNRVRQVRSRGAMTPLTPLVQWDVTRASPPTEDHLGRQRVAELLGLSIPDR
jgi:hypothetical protein